MNLRFLAVLLAVCLIQAEGSSKNLKSKLSKLSAQRSSHKKSGIRLLTGTFTSTSPLFCPADEAKIKAAFDKAFKPNAANAITANPLPSAFIIAYSAQDNIQSSAWILVDALFNEAKGRVLYAFVDYNARTRVGQIDMTTVKNVNFNTLFVTAIAASGITPATTAGVNAQFTSVLDEAKEQLNTLLIAARTAKTASLMALTQRDKTNLERIVTDIMDSVHDQFHTFLLTSISSFNSKAISTRQMMLSVASSFESIVRTAMGPTDRNSAHQLFEKAVAKAFEKLRNEINGVQHWVTKAATMAVARLQKNVEKTILDQVYIDIAAVVATTTCPIVV